MAGYFLVSWLTQTQLGSLCQHEQNIVILMCLSESSKTLRPSQPTPQLCCIRCHCFINRTLPQHSLSLLRSFRHYVTVGTCEHVDRDHTNDKLRHGLLRPDASVSGI